MSWPEDNPVLVRKAEAGCEIAAWHLHRLRCLKRNIDPASQSARFELAFSRAVEDLEELQRSHSHGVVRFPPGIRIASIDAPGGPIPETGVPL